MGVLNPKKLNKDRKIFNKSLMSLSGGMSMQQRGTSDRKVEWRLETAFKTSVVSLQFSYILA